MKEFRGRALCWEWREGVLELTLDREPLNEIGSVMLQEYLPGEEYSVDVYVRRDGRVIAAVP